MTHLPVLARVPALVIHQHKEMLEVFTDFETRNRYVVEFPDGQPALYAAELGRGGWAFLVRSVLKASRPFTMELRDASGHVALTLERPWRWYFAELQVHDGQRRPVGSIVRRWALLSRRFSVLDASGRELATLHGPLLRPWTFRVMQGTAEVGRITKKWSGLLREAFTDADTFGVELGSAMDPQLRTLVLAATFLIDFLYFEDRD